MSIQAPARSAEIAGAGSIGRDRRLNLRPPLAFLTVLALVAATVAGSVAARANLDADLARILRFMAALKLAFAVVAVVASWWRLGRATDAWRSVAYVAGPPLAMAGSILMLSLQHLGIAAVTLHLGLLATLAAALTDGNFLVIARARSFGGSRDAG